MTDGQGTDSAERRISDIFAVEDEIATTVANALASRVAPLRSDPRFARLLQGMGFDGGTA